MANTDKNIVITPNIGQTGDPQIVFSGANATLGPQNITLRVYPTDNGTLSFEGSAGQLFSLTNSLTGTIYSVNDVSGIPSIEVLDTGLVKLAQYGGNIVIGSGTDNGTHKVQVTGTALFNNPTILTGSREVRVDLGTGAEINLSSGNFFTKTISANTTFSITNIPTAGTSVSFILDLTNGGAGTVGWWNNVKWPNQTAPTLTNPGRDVLGFFTHDAGSTWTGLLLGKDIK